MRYPTLTVSATQKLSGSLVRGESIVGDLPVHWMGRGEELDLNEIGACASQICGDLESALAEGGGRDPDAFEGRAAVALFRSLAGLPLAVLDDPGFWRYLTIAHFWPLVRWREASAFESGDYGRFRRYVDGANPAECVLLRMYLRGRIVEGGDDPDLAYRIPFGADFWRSHVFRVRTGTAPVVARAFAEAQAGNRMQTDELRSLARDLNRLWANVIPYVYEPDEATALIDELRSTSDGS